MWNEANKLSLRYPLCAGIDWIFLFSPKSYYSWLFSYLSYRNPRIVKSTNPSNLLRDAIQEKKSRACDSLIYERFQSKFEARKVPNWHDIKRKYNDRKRISNFDRRSCNYWSPSKFNSQIGLLLGKRQYCDWD